MVRACIYHIRSSECFWRFSLYTIETLKKHCDKIVVVSDLPLIKGEKSECPVFMHWGEAFGVLGQCEPDEVLLLDERWCGPVFEADDMFKTADRIQSNAWIITQGAPMFGIRKAAWDTQAFSEWVGQGASLDKLETALINAGIRVEPLYDATSIANYTSLPMMDEPVRMLRDFKCPFFMHWIFRRPYDEVITTSFGQAAVELVRYLENDVQWDMDPMWDYLIKVCHQEELYWNLHLSFVASTKVCDRKSTEAYIGKNPLVLVMHLYYEDLIEQSASYARRFPQQTHIYVTTSSEEKKKKIEAAFADVNCNKLEVRVIMNRGRDVSSLLVGVKDVIDQYEIACFFHDKKTLQSKPGTIGVGFAYRCNENLFANEKAVLNVVRNFEKNPRLGILSPPPPHHSDYFFTLGTAWGPNYANTRTLYDRMGMDVPIAPDKMPLAPLGTCFWFRVRAMKPLYDMDWEYEDFPPEPNNADGTILHAIERIYPFCAQQAGYYAGYLFSDTYAPIEYGTMYQYNRGYQKVLLRHGIMSYQLYMRYMLHDRMVSREIQSGFKIELRKRLSKITILRKCYRFLRRYFKK